MNAKITVLLSIMASHLISPPSTAANRVVHYDPAVVELEGTIEKQTFPGPPNYESIKNGDRIETGWFLRLSEKIDVPANVPGTDLGYNTELNVKILHMITDYEDLEQKKMLIVSKTRKVLVKGKLLNAITGHHHSRVLIDVEKITEVNK